MAANYENPELPEHNPYLKCDPESIIFVMNHMRQIIDGIMDTRLKDLDMTVKVLLAIINQQIINQQQEQLRLSTTTPLCISQAT